MMPSYLKPFLLYAVGLNLLSCFHAKDPTLIRWVLRSPSTPSYPGVIKQHGNFPLSKLTSSSLIESSSNRDNL